MKKLTTATTQTRYDAVVLTSAALPWMTGPSFISLWHACGLAALGYKVVYMLPWLDGASQERLWGARRFADFDEQVEWLRAEAGDLGCPDLPECRPYRGTYMARLKSIVPMQDVYRAAPSARSLIASEPEHLCWYPFTRGRKHIRADRTLGLSMTDYETYIRSSDIPAPRRVAQLVSYLHGRAVRLRIDLPLSLSPALAFPGVNMPVERITGVSRGYAHVPPVAPDIRGVYFLGSFLWEKGLSDLVQIAKRAEQPMDVIGGGPDEAAFRNLVQQENAPLTVKAPNARFWKDIGRYRVMLNPSKSEVLCTATADALVAGRHVVLPNCPGNVPFSAYPNAHFYKDLDGAITALRQFVASDPVPPEAARRDFDWMQACRKLAELSGLANPRTVRVH